MSNLFLRMVTASLLLPLFLFLVYKNGVPFYCLILLIFVISLYELIFLYKKNIFHYFLLGCLIIFFLFSLYRLRGSGDLNFYYLLWVMSVVWLSDTGGFLFGRIIKGPKLSKWSPNKTISGFFGSIFLGQFAFLILFYFENNLISFNFKFFALQLLISISAVFGDLFFSFVKRKNNIKDYSNIFPGHGGLLDRADGLIFAVIIAYILKLVNVY